VLPTPEVIEYAFRPLIRAGLVFLLCGMQPVFAVGERILRDIPYLAKTISANINHRQTLDLYLPASKKKLPPLVAFVHGGGFWSMSDDALGVGSMFAKALVEKGAAVALIRYRLAPPGRFPENAEDVAQAVSYLQKGATQYGYDANKIYLAGHSAGAHLVSLVTLDQRYAHTLNQSGIAGVIAVSGIYDLTENGPLARLKNEILSPVFGSSMKLLSDASPLNHARRGPAFLILSAENDFNLFQLDARHFAAALRAKGNTATQEVIIAGADHSNIINIQIEKNPARALLMDFIGLDKASPVISTLVQARRVWQEPPYSTEPFWKHANLIRDYPVDERFRIALKKIYEYTAFELKAYPLKTFHAMNLEAYLNAESGSKIGKGDYLILTNVRGEKLYWKRQDIEPYKPVLVVGLDDERNLFRLTVFYQNKLEYSWKPDTPYLMARSVGGFIYFLKDPPESLQPPTASMYALTPDSFKLVEQDPLAPLANLPQKIHDVMLYRNACISCHGFRGINVRAGHVRARNGEVSGGFALPLETYPDEAFRRFMFEPDRAAAMMGVRPNAVDNSLTKSFYDLVVSERARASKVQETKK